MEKKTKRSQEVNWKPHEEEAPLSGSHPSFTSGGGGEKFKSKNKEAMGHGKRDEEGNIRKHRLSFGAHQKRRRREVTHTECKKCKRSLENIWGSPAFLGPLMTLFIYGSLGET